MTELPATSIRKAAILVASLDTDLADELLDQMPAAQADLVRRYVDQLGDVDPVEEANVIREFFRRPSRHRAATLRSKPAERRHVRVDSAHASTAPTAASHERFTFLREARAARLTPILASEHPQTIAVVVAHLPPEQAAEMLATLPADLQLQVIRRLIVLDDADADVLHEVEHGLKSRVAELIQDERRRAAGAASVATILDAASPSTRRLLLANMARQDRDLAQTVGQRNVDFEELEFLDDDALRLVLAEADPEIVRLALAAALPSLLQRFLGLVTPPEARALRKAIETLGPTRLSDVEEAQRSLAASASQLALAGRIELPARWSQTV